MENLTWKQMFGMSEQLIVEQSDEIFGVSQISWENSPWKQFSLVTSATTVESQVIRPSFVVQKVEKQKERERRDTAKVGMTVKVGQSERDGQKAKVGTHQVKVGSNKDQQE